MNDRIWLSVVFLLAQLAIPIPGVSFSPAVDAPVIICAIAHQQEKRYIDEWITYHLNIGFDGIQVFDNSESNALSSVAARYGSRVGVRHYPGSLMQMPAYNLCHQTFKAARAWAAFIDIDEFIVIRNRSLGIKDLVQMNGQNGGAISLNWMLFGSDGQLHYNTTISSTDTGAMANSPIGDHARVLRRFTSRSNRLDPHVKSIAYLPDVDYIQHPHFPALVGNFTQVDTNGRRFLGPANPYGDDKVACIHHYFSKSMEEFQAKRARGRADIGYFNTNTGQQEQTVRDIDDFDQHDLNIIIDTRAVDIYTEQLSLQLRSQSLAAGKRQLKQKQEQEQEQKQDMKTNGYAACNLSSDLIVNSGNDAFSEVGPDTDFFSLFESLFSYPAIATIIATYRGVDINNNAQQHENRFSEKSSPYITPSFRCCSQNHLRTLNKSDIDISNKDDEDHDDDDDKEEQDDDNENCCTSGTVTFSVIVASAGDTEVMLVYELNLLLTPPPPAESTANSSECILIGSPNSPLTPVYRVQNVWWYDVGVQLAVFCIDTQLTEQACNTLLHQRLLPVLSQLGVSTQSRPSRTADTGFPEPSAAPTSASKNAQRTTGFEVNRAATTSSSSSSSPSDVTDISTLVVAGPDSIAAGTRDVFHYYRRGDLAPHEIAEMERINTRLYKQRELESITKPNPTSEIVEGSAAAAIGVAIKELARSQQLPCHGGWANGASSSDNTSLVIIHHDDTSARLSARFFSAASAATDSTATTTTGTTAVAVGAVKEFRLSPDVVSVRVRSTIFFEYVIYRDYFPFSVHEWKDRDYVAVTTYKTFNQFSSFCKGPPPAEVLSAAGCTDTTERGCEYEGEYDRLLSVAKTYDYDVVPLVRSKRSLMVAATVSHTRAFRAAWYALLEAMGYEYATIQLYDHARPFYRNSMLIKPSWLADLSLFMNQAMDVAMLNRTVKVLLQRSAGYGDVGSSEVARRVFNTSDGSYRLYPFVFERLPSFYLLSEGARVCHANRRCPYNTQW